MRSGIKLQYTTACTAVKNCEFFPLRHIIEALTTTPTSFFKLAHISELINEGMGEREEGKRVILNGMHKRPEDKEILTDTT